MAWEEPSVQLIERVDIGSWLIRAWNGAGCSAAPVHREREHVCGVYRQSVVVRLTESARERLLAEGRAEPFSVSGRTMREYVMLTDALARTHADTIALIDEAFAFASALPAKKKSGNASSPSKRKR